MAKAYLTSGSNASGNSNKTLLTVIGSTTVRPRVFEVGIGNSQTPGDQAANYRLNRFTTGAGTAGNSPTPEPLDSADVAAIATAGNAHSAEPTYTAAKFMQFSVNMRATWRWVANPGAEFVGPATATTGFGLFLSSSTAAMVSDATMMWYE